MGTTGIFSKDISKFTVDRRKFIEWAIVDNPGLFMNIGAMVADLVGCGEHIIEAQTILDTYNEIPSFLVMENVDEPFVNPQDCVMSYFREHEKEEDN